MKYDGTIVWSDNFYDDEIYANIAGSVGGQHHYVFGHLMWGLSIPNKEQNWEAQISISHFKIKKGEEWRQVLAWSIESNKLYMWAI